MTISRVKPAGWGIGDKLTSAEQNGVDTNATYALDKRAGQTDSLASVVTLAATGRIVQSVAPAADADTTFQIDAQVLGVRIGTPNILTAQRAYTLSNTSAVNGDEISFFFDPDALGSYNALIKDNGGATLATLGPTGQAHWGEFKFISGAWKLKRFGGTKNLRTDTFSANGTWTCPAGVTEVLLEGVGAGGGGGGGAGTAAGAADTGCSGGGGGGALLGTALVAVTPGTTYTITSGTAGAGGAAGAVDGAGGDGADGGDTTFAAPGPSTLATFRGAGGGKGGAAPSGNDYSPGGRSMKLGVIPATTNTLGDYPRPGDGGWGFYTAFTPIGSAYTNGGAQALGPGGTTGDHDGGIGGAGGGMSGFSGAAPGNGGDAALDTVGAPGTAGTLGAGGGGGASGGALGTDRAGGAGGAGGAGALRIIYVR